LVSAQDPEAGKLEGQELRGLSRLLWGWRRF